MHKIIFKIGEVEEIVFANDKESLVRDVAEKLHKKLVEKHININKSYTVMKKINKPPEEDFIRIIFTFETQEEFKKAKEILSGM